MDRRRCSIVISALPLILHALATAAHAGNVAVVTTDAALYSSMTNDAKPVASLRKGQRVRIGMTIAGVDGGWCQVLADDAARASGFVRCRHLERLQPDLARWRSSFDTGLAASREQRHADAETALRAALDEADLLDITDPRLGMTINRFTDALLAQGKYTDAEPLVLRSMAIVEGVAGKDSPFLAQSMLSAAAFYGNSGKPREALRLLDSALALQERQLGPSHPEVAMTLDRLAMWLRDAHAYAEAEAVGRRSLDIRERAFGPDHPAVAASLATLGMLYRDQNKRSDAYAALNRAAAIHERTTRPDDPDVAITLLYLGDMLAADARYAEAERQYRRALVKVTKTVGPDHQYAGVIALSLAKMFRAQGKREDAERFYRQGLAVMVCSSSSPTSRIGTNATRRQPRRSGTLSGDTRPRCTTKEASCRATIGSSSSARGSSRIPAASCPTAAETTGPDGVSESGPHNLAGRGGKLVADRAAWNGHSAGTDDLSALCRGRQ